MKRNILISCLLLLLMSGCAQQKETDQEDPYLYLLPRYEYELNDIKEVDGRQGVCYENGFYWISGSTTISKYDENWNLISSNADPFDGNELEVNHIGDIDVYDNELYLGVELFVDGVGQNIHVAVYDADTLKLKRVFPFDDSTGQKECSGIAVDPDKRIVYMTSWIDDQSSSYIYSYSLDTGAYLGKIHMNPYPEWLQGIAYYDGFLYVTCDDGVADDKEADHLYRLILNGDGTATCVYEKAFDDVLKQGEIEGLTFNKDKGQFMLLYNRGARIILGMPSGFYEGYDHEIHEVFIYDLKEIKR